MDLIYILDEIGSTEALCNSVAMQNISYLIGIVMTALKVAVPIILIFVGMIDMVQAITSQDENAIKKSGSKLAKKAVAAVAVFLVATIVGLLMSLVGGEEYELCMDCINHPFSQCSGKDFGNGSNK